MVVPTLPMELITPALLMTAGVVLVPPVAAYVIAPELSEVGAVMVGMMPVPNTTLELLKLKPDKVGVAAVTVKVVVVVLLA